MSARVRSATWLVVGLVVGSAVTYTVRPNHRPTPWVGEAEAGLDRIVERVEAVDRPLADVLDDVARSSGANISVRWAALNESGLEKSTPVRLHLQRMPLRRVLEELLRQVNGSYHTTKFRADRGAIVISTAGDLDLDSVIRMYDVADLLDAMASGALEEPASDTPGQVLNGSVFSSTLGGSLSASELARREAAEQLIMMIQEISPDMWREAGGSIGSVKRLSDLLIITHTPEAHLEISRVLDELRWQLVEKGS